MSAKPDVRLGAWCAAAAALVWGATVPFSKRVADLGVPALEAGALLFGGAALGLGLFAVASRRRFPPLTATDWRWLLASGICGGLCAPALLVFGQAQTSGMASAVLLALEPPATALFAVGFFRERGSKHLLAGCILATLGALVVTQASPAEGAPTTLLGGAAVAAAACAWGLDSNLMARVSRHDPLWMAVIKGGVGSLAAVALASIARVPFAAPWTPAAIVELMVVGLIGYGGCLSFITRAFREIGAARAGAIFASAPLFAALLAVPVLGERPTWALGAAAVFLAAGTYTITRE